MITKQICHPGARRIIIIISVYAVMKVINDFASSDFPSLTEIKWPRAREATSSSGYALNDNYVELSVCNKNCV